jgi:hypothetical protein
MKQVGKKFLLLCFSFLLLTGIQEPVFAFQMMNDANTFRKGSTIANPAVVQLEESIEPDYQGQFISAGQVRTFTFEITNDSFATMEVFKFQVESAWTTKLFAKNGQELIDDDGDSLLECDPVYPQAKVTINAEVSAPAIANVGDYNVATVTVFPESTGTIKQIHVLQNTVPAPFAQMYADYGKNNIYLNLVSPDKQTVHTTGPLDRYGFFPGLAGGNQFVLTWLKHSREHIAWYADIEYSMFDHNGEPIIAQSKFTQNYDDILTISDVYQVAAITDNGLTGIFWVRSIYENLVTRPVQNLWFAVLNQDGSYKFSPEQITDNVIPYELEDGRSYRNTGIAAIGADRFVLAWAERLDGGFDIVESVSYCVFDSNGEIVKTASNLTGKAYSTNFSENNPRPLSITNLQNERAIIVFADETNLFYSVVNQNGVIVKRATDSGFPRNNVDVVQLSGGNTIAAMPVIEADGWFNTFILDGEDYEVIQRSAAGQPDKSYYNQYTLSVTRDDANHAILSWVSPYRSYTYEHLMYSLLDASGNTITPPTRFYRAAVIDVNTPWIIYPLVASPNGYGNAAFSQPASGRGSDLSILSEPVVPVKPGQQAIVPIKIRNQGLSKASGIQISMVFDKNLKYIGDTLGIVPQKTGKAITWQIPDLDYLGQGKFEVAFQTDSAELGTRLPVVFLIQSDQAECFSADNKFSLEIIVSEPIYFPFISR